MSHGAGRRRVATMSSSAIQPATAPLRRDLSSADVGADARTLGVGTAGEEGAAMATHMHVVVVSSELVHRDRPVKVEAKACESLIDFVSELRSHLSIGEEQRVSLLYEQDGSFLPMTTANLKEAFRNQRLHQASEKIRVRVESENRDLLDIVSGTIAQMLREHKDDGRTDEVCDQMRTQLEKAGVPKDKWVALSSAFKNLDTDGDELIEQHELVTAIQAREESLSTQDIRDLWKEIDIDLIDFAAFCK